jgi:hypothetical protein
MNSGPSLPVLPEGFGRAAEKLADTVRHVVDIAVGPERIRARARAQADSAVILAEGQARVQEVEARAVERLRKREGRRQQNIESITVKALKALPPPEQISKEPVSEDWTSRFFEESQDISDEEMQQLWARIMAGEVAQPGSFAPRTLSVVRDLTKNDAALFTKLCRFVWHIPGVGFLPVIHDADAPEVLGAGLSFSALTHLTSIGLIEFNSLTGFGLKTNIKEITISYCGEGHQLQSEGGQERRFQIGKALFTAVGSELLKIANAKGGDEYKKAALDHWHREQWKDGGASAANPPSTP